MRTLNNLFMGESVPAFIERARLSFPCEIECGLTPLQSIISLKHTHSQTYIYNVLSNKKHSTKQKQKTYDKTFAKWKITQKNTLLLCYVVSYSFMYFY